MLGAVVLSFINYYLIPDVFNDYPQKLGLDFDLTELSLRHLRLPARDHDGARPEGLLPERRRQLELREGVGAGDTELGGGETMYEARA